MKNYTAGDNELNMRLSRFVQRVTRNLPESALHKNFRNRRIKVNGKRAAPDYLLQVGDEIQLYISDEFFWEASRPQAQSAKAIGPLPPFSIVYQNEQLAILYKPAGVLSHPEKGDDASLLDAFTHSLIQSGEYTPQTENIFAPALCNRLDRGTEGLIVAAKQQPALRDMNALIRDGYIKKLYLCITTSPPPEGTHTAFLLRHRDTYTVEIKTTAFHDAKEITTGVRVIESAKGLSLCEVELITGRTHQIRAHLAFLGAPLLGDRKYGAHIKGNSFAAKTTQSLCAWRLEFCESLPPQNTLHSLAGRVFTAQQATLPKWWKAQTSK